MTRTATEWPWTTASPVRKLRSKANRARAKADSGDLLDRAQAAAERGLELDEDESECHRILAQVFIQRHDLARARQHQERALFLNPNDDRSVCAMGTILVLAGQPEEAESWIRKAMRLNPYHPEAYWFHLGRALFHAGRDEEALTALRRVTRYEKQCDRAVLLEALRSAGLA